MVSKPFEILLIEDNPGDVRLLMDFMKRSKIANNVNSVENGAQALDYLQRKGKYSNALMPDLILLDLNMPIKGGREVLAEVKEDSKLKHIPIIVLTTSDAPMDINHAYQLHANCYLTKPSDLDQFYRMVSAIEDFWMTLAKIPRHH